MIAAEQKARVTYDNILRLSDDPDVNNVIQFLRQREINHFQRFGEALYLLKEKLNQKKCICHKPRYGYVKNGYKLCCCKDSLQQHKLFSLFNGTDNSFPCRAKNNIDQKFRDEIKQN